MAQGKQRPGVMLYFDAMRPALNRLNDAQVGALIRAILSYAEFGEITELDMMCDFAFEMLRPKIDHDAEQYEKSRKQRQYAVYKRDMNKYAWPELTYEQWLSSEYCPHDDLIIGSISTDSDIIEP